MLSLVDMLLNIMLSLVTILLLQIRLGSTDWTYPGVDGDPIGGMDDLLDGIIEDEGVRGTPAGLPLPDLGQVLDGG